MDDVLTGVTSGRRHRADLDGLRGVVAAVVVVCHSMGEDGFSTPQHFPLGVDFFFVLSGYVIANAYGARLAAGRMTFRRFAELRIIRLHPLLVLGTMIALAGRLLQMIRGVSPHTPGVVGATLLTMVTGLLCIPWHPLRMEMPLFPLDGPQWSLYAEYVFNIAFALLAPWLSLRMLIAVVIAGIAAMIGLIEYHGSISVGFVQGQGLEAVLRGIGPFFMGVLVFRLEEAGRLPRFVLPWWVQAGVLTAILLAPGREATPIFDLIVVLVVWPLIIVGGGADRFGPRLRAFLLWAGALSYPIYVLHIPLIHPIAKVGQVIGHSQPLLTLAAQCLCTVLIAQLALRFYDVPLRRWLDRRSRVATPAA